MDAIAASARGRSGGLPWPYGSVVVNLAVARPPSAANAAVPVGRCRGAGAAGPVRTASTDPEPRRSAHSIPSRGVHVFDEILVPPYGSATAETAVDLPVTSAPGAS